MAWLSPLFRYLKPKKMFSFDLLFWPKEIRCSFRNCSKLKTVVQCSYLQSGTRQSRVFLADLRRFSSGNCCLLLKLSHHSVQKSRGATHQALYSSKLRVAKFMSSDLVPGPDFVALLKFKSRCLDRLLKKMILL